MIYKHYHINQFLDFSRGQRLCPIDSVVLTIFRIGTPFSSIFLRVTPLEPKGALPSKELPLWILNGMPLY